MTYRINKVNAYNGWDPLKQVVLGNVYLPEFFDGMPDVKLMDMFKRIMEETHEDLDGIESTLKEHGVDVVRLPAGTTSVDTLHSKDGTAIKPESIKDYIDGNVELQGAPRPALAPRDNFITLGNKVLQTTSTQELEAFIDPECLDNRLISQYEYHQEMNTRLIANNKTYAGPFVPGQKFLEELFGEEFKYNPEWFDKEKRADIWRFGDKEHPDYDPLFEPVMNYTWFCWAPTMTRVGDTIIYDVEEITNMDKVISKFTPQFKKSKVAIGGHNDGTFCLAKPGLCISASWGRKEDFEKTLPGWEILVLKQETEKAMSSEFGNWWDQKNLTRGKWWHPGVKENPEMINFVDQWLNKWVGYAEESIFEVNMLSLNPECILSLNYQENIHTKLREHGIEPIYCRFRHRNFWDAGLHCLTVDTLREGGQQNYGL